jgi:hypothetical protein
MAQQFPTTAKAIYDALVADAQFMSYLGTYNFKSGSGPLAAISIVSAGEDLPSVRKVQGLECIIQDAGDTSRIDYLTGDSNIEVEFSLFLVCWDGAKGSDMQAAAERAVSMFGKSQSIQTVATPDGVGSLVQTKVVISSLGPILAV